MATVGRLFAAMAVLFIGFIIRAMITGESFGVAVGVFVAFVAIVGLATAVWMVGRHFQT